MVKRSRAVLRDFWQLMRPYWVSEEKRVALSLLATVVGITLAIVYVNVLFNAWYNDFYNSLQEKDTAGFFRLMGKFAGLATVYILLRVYQVYLQQGLQMRWRRWMTESYLRDWLTERAYYRMQLTGATTDNPDQRIADDINKFVDLSLTLSLGLLEAVVTLISFVGILWTISGPLPFTWNGTTWELHGYMVWVALAYAAIGSGLAHVIGRPLIRMRFDQHRYEGDFRFGLARFRENTEGVALYRGEDDEQAGARRRFGAVLDNWWRIMKRSKLLNFYSFSYGQVAVVFPFLVGAPRYFSGAIQLGGLMQISNAFGQVQQSLSWFINVYDTFAEWKATVDRLTGFRAAIGEAHAASRDDADLVRETGSDGALALDDVTVSLPDARPLFAALDARFAPGERVLLRGPSGSGKSTLFRVIAGIWPFARGSIRLPRHFAPLFLPQRPYFPLGTLRAAVSFPQPEGHFEDVALRQVLADVGLAPLADRLDETATWSQALSGGEQQRVAIARALLHRPGWLFLDEATSALDPAAESAMYELLRARLPDCTVVSISHRPELDRHHHRTLLLDPDRPGILVPT